MTKDVEDQPEQSRVSRVTRAYDVSWFAKPGPFNRLADMVRAFYYRGLRTRVSASSRKSSRRPRCTRPSRW